MSKGIIVLDVPERCGDCIFSNPDGDYCPFHGEIAYPEYETKKPDWCPIQPFPERKPSAVFATTPMLEGNYFEPHDEGWNACIDRILERSNEKKEK